MEFTQDELELIWFGLQSLISDNTFLVEDHIDGDEVGIKCNLEVQNIVYCALVEFKNSIELLEKLKNDKRLVLLESLAKKNIATHKEVLTSLNSEIRRIQNG